jgi:type II restriction/modification system DNA methylase subunit YeeA
MPPTLTPQDFVAKWRDATVKERSGYQEHFMDLCRLVGHATPVEADPSGQHFTFEAGARKLGGKQGWADVWKKGFFAWEYKGKDADLTAAYRQLLQYREDLENPPLLIVCDFKSIVIHPQFVNVANKPLTLTLDDLLLSEKLDVLRKAFHEPDALHPTRVRVAVTQKAANEFGKIAENLRQAGADSPAIAHFLIRLLFCLFAEDVGILPSDLFTQLVTQPGYRPAVFTAQLRQLFSAMAHGGPFGFHLIPHVNGGLFEDDAALELDPDSRRILVEVCGLDWSAIEPSIFGTLFERSLDPDRRSQLGAHFTGLEDILLIVEPVLMAPLRRQWEAVKTKALALSEERNAARGQRRKTLESQMFTLLDEFRAELARVEALDPACGSGSFLYVALRQLLDLEYEVSELAAALGGTRSFPQVGPEQLHGIEINPYAYELAQATIWIGYLQWWRDHGYGVTSEPILRSLDAIVKMDAILAFDAEGNATEPEWPPADVIIGNPPFLGGKRLRTELGDAYVDNLFALYDGRVPREADLVTYWFEKARAYIEQGKVKRAGLLATQGIRGGANRKVLQRIKETGDIFWAVSDRDWILDGANVHVSMVGYDNGSETARELDGQSASGINTRLTASIDITMARRLMENRGISFMGITPAGPFDIPELLAREWMAQPLNPNGRPNSDVLRPYFNGADLTGRPQGRWIIDFGVGMSLEEASLYEAPFKHVTKNVKPLRERNNRQAYREKWWQFAEARPTMRHALSSVSMYIGTSMVSKHFFFNWLPANVLPANLIIAFARGDDYFFGVLHSRVHEVWARAMGTQLREAESGFRYTPTTTFETFPFPWPPGAEPQNDPRVEAIAAAARDLVGKRDAWLDPPGATAADLKKRTLTNLYNERPTWLALAHRRLDEAVLDAYGWPHDLTDDDLLARLLALNLERSEKPK